MRTAIENALHYGAKKSEQNMAVALEACTEDFTLYSPSFGANFEGKKECLRGMSVFFKMFPDYNVLTDHTAIGQDFVVLTGRVQLTPDFSVFQLDGKGEMATIDFSAAFTVQNDLLLKETFMVDILGLCRQSGLPLEVARIAFKI